MKQVGDVSGTRRFDVVALGDPVLDLVLHARQVPGWDDKCLGTQAGFFAGGSEANMVSAASRLNLRTALFGQLGTDVGADWLREELLRFGVSDRYLRQAPDVHSAKAAVFVSESGERAIAYVAAHPAHDRSAELARMLGETRCVYTLPYDLAAFEKMVAMARRTQTTVVVDVERAVAAQPGAPDILFDSCDILLFNEAGFRTACGLAPDLDRLQQLIRQTRAHTLVVSMGAAGALAVDTWHNVASRPAYPAQVVDATGAGDCFNGAFLAAHLTAASLQDALDYACAAASVCIESVGARAGLPSPEAVRTRQSLSVQTSPYPRKGA